MKYPEYLKSAEKHLKGCLALLSSYTAGNHDPHVWLELYYLSGYIIEGLTIYSVYNLYGWHKHDDIMSINLAFTQSTGLDFYYNRKEKIVNGVQITPPLLLNRPKGALSVQGHKFQEIVKQLLKPNPTFNGIPYFGDGAIDRDVETLIDHWDPKVRYYYSTQQKIYPPLNSDVIQRLLLTCSTIYTNHI